MRIIAGSKARASLLSPRDFATRPITDRVKEAVFAILEGHISGVQVMDLFCGTGSLGLEALSRGAGYALMVEKGRDAVKRLKKNIAKLNFQDRTTVIQADAFKYVADGLPKADDKNAEECQFHLAFVDPPYALSRQATVDSKLGLLLTGLGDHLMDKAVAVVRHERRVELRRCYGHLHHSDRREYGGMAVTFLEKIVAR